MHTMSALTSAACAGPSEEKNVVNDYFDIGLFFDALRCSGPNNRIAP